MRAGLLVGLVAAVLSLPRAAPAAPFTDLLDGLKAEVDAQVLALAGATDPDDKKVLKALQKAQTLLAKPPKSILGDMGLALKAAKGLEAKVSEDFPGKAALLLALDGAAQAFEDLVADANDADAALIAGLADAALAAKLTILHDAVAASLDAAGSAPDNASRLKLVILAWKKSLSIDANIRKIFGKGGMGALVNGEVFVSPSDFTFGDCYDNVGTYYVQGQQPLPNGDMMFLSLSFGGVDVRGMTDTTFPFTGTAYAAISIESAGNPPDSSTALNSGSVTVHEYDAVKGTISGTFWFVTNDGMYSVSNGTFLVRDARLRYP